VDSVVVKQTVKNLHLSRVRIFAFTFHHPFLLVLTYFFCFAVSTQEDYAPVGTSGMEPSIHDDLEVSDSDTEAESSSQPSQKQPEDDGEGLWF